MNQPAKAQEPSMEEILASIRRIIADEDTGKAAKPAAPPPAPKPQPTVVAKPAAPPPQPAPAPANNQSDIDAMLAEIDPPKPAPPPPPAAFVPPPPPPSPPVPDVLDLTEAMAAPAPEPSAFRTIDAASDVVFTDRASETPMDRDAYRPAPAPAPSDYQGLISSSTMSAVDSAFNSLAHTVLGNNARTLEDLVKEMLRPMLKGWLDDNLPNMVERIVRAEIERVSRGRS
jgi:cell pole-organizing protein PopZ